jgi:hypothetical protein
VLICDRSKDNEKIGLDFGDIHFVKASVFFGMPSLLRAAKAKLIKFYLFKKGN